MPRGRQGAGPEVVKGAEVGEQSGGQQGGAGVGACRQQGGAGVGVQRVMRDIDSMLQVGTIQSKFA